MSITYFMVSAVFFLQFLTELSNALDAVAASKCSVVVVNTVGNTFCSGLDVHYLVEVLSSSKNVSNTAKYLAESVRYKMLFFNGLCWNLS